MCNYSNIAIKAVSSPVRLIPLLLQFWCVSSKCFTPYSNVFLQSALLHTPYFFFEKSFCVQLSRSLIPFTIFVCVQLSFVLFTWTECDLSLTLLDLWWAILHTVVEGKCILCFCSGSRSESWDRIWYWKDDSTSYVQRSDKSGWEWRYEHTLQYLTLFFMHAMVLILVIHGQNIRASPRVC